MNYWLMKSEPSTFSIDALSAAPKRQTFWDGVRNYQVRNMMRDDMKVGDLAFFYHSSCDEPGIAGVGVDAAEPETPARHRRQVRWTLEASGTSSRVGAMVRTA